MELEETIGDPSVDPGEVEATVDHLGQDEFRAGLVAGSEESIGQVLESDGVELVDHGRLLLGLGRTGIRRRPPVRSTPSTTSDRDMGRPTG